MDSQLQPPTKFLEAAHSSVPVCENDHSLGSLTLLVRFARLSEGVPMTFSRPPRWENFLIVAILIAGMVAGWSGYERFSSSPTIIIQRQ